MTSSELLKNYSVLKIENLKIFQILTLNISVGGPDKNLKFAHIKDGNDAKLYYKFRL